MARLDPVLGIDFGLKRIGVAIGNTLTGTARPLRHVGCSRKGPNWARIRRYIEQWHPGIVVIGLPIALDGEETPMSGRARQFGAELQRRFTLPVTYMDERLTSVEADWIIRAETADGRKMPPRRAGVRDNIAAQLIVQSYLRGDGNHE